MASSEDDFGGKVSCGMKDVSGHQGAESTTMRFEFCMVMSKAIFSRYRYLIIMEGRWNLNVVADFEVYKQGLI